MKIRAVYLPFSFCFSLEINSCNCKIVKMAFNAVMLEKDMRNPTPLPNENFLYHCSGVKFELKRGEGYPGNSNNKKSAGGTAFVSSKRIVYLSSHTTPDASNNNSQPDPVNSFTVPLVNLRDMSFSQPIFGANRFEARLSPAVQGMDKLVLSFTEGGGFDFADTAKKMGERIRESDGQHEPPHEEELPAYPDEEYPSDAPPGYEAGHQQKPLH